MTLVASIRAAAAPALLLALVPQAWGQAPAGSAVSSPETLTWTEIVPGVSFGGVYGDWSAEAHGKLVRFAPGLESPVHTHTHAYHGVVISGIVTNPYPGEESPPRMGPGTYFHVPAGAPHTTGCVSEEPCLFYTHGDELWDLQVPEEGS